MAVVDGIDGAGILDPVVDKYSVGLGDRDAARALDLVVDWGIDAVTAVDDDTV